MVWQKQWTIKHLLCCWKEFQKQISQEIVLFTLINSILIRECNMVIREMVWKDQLFLVLFCGWSSCSVQVDVMDHKGDFGKSNSLHMGLLQGTAESEKSGWPWHGLKLYPWVIQSLLRSWYQKCFVLWPN